MRWLGVLFLATFVFGNEDVFEECVHHEICIEEEGKVRIQECFSILAPPDQDLVIESFSKFFPGSGNDFQVLLDLNCEDKETSKKAVDYYYDKRLEKSKKNEQPTEEKKKMVEARGCVMMMIEECRTKKVMGLIT